MKMPQIAGVLFDCDGVLVDSEAVGLDAATDYLAAKGLPMAREEIVLRFTGMRTDRFRGELRDLFEDSRGGRVSDASFEAFFEGFLETRRANRHLMALVPGAADAVTAAIHRKLGVAVASSSAKVYLDSKIDRFGLRGYFGDHVYSADVVAHGKPAPDIFLHAAMRIGISPDQCLVIEDSCHGVTAGRAAGAVVWGFGGGGHSSPALHDRLEASGASRVARTHEELADWIAAL